MISLKKEISVCENACDPLDEDQVAAADLVVANAQSPSNSGTLLSSNTNQRVIQVMQCTSNNSSGTMNSSSPRYCQLRPLQSLQLHSTANTNIMSNNSAFQYTGSMAPLGSQVMKNQPILEFNGSKMMNQTNQLMTPDVSGNVTLAGPSIHNPGTAFGMNIAQASLQLNNSGVGLTVSAPSAVTSHAPNVPSSQARKPCNCTKSHCLKLYCDCFAHGQLCQNCNCTNCMNNLQYEEERARVIKMTLDRNPMAFHPKIGRGDGERKHTKGCNCKKSGCLKNYCECYEAKISCTELCRCQGCKNTDDGMERRSLMRLSMMSQTMKARQQVHSRKSFVGPVQETEKVMESGDGSWSNSVIWDSSANVTEAGYNRRNTSPTVFGSFLPEAKTPLLPPASCLTAGFGVSSEAGAMPSVSTSGVQSLSYSQEAAATAAVATEQKRVTTEDHVASCCSYAAFLESGSNEMISPEDAHKETMNVKHSNGNSVAFPEHYSTRRRSTSKSRMASGPDKMSKLPSCDSTIIGWSPVRHRLPSFFSLPHNFITWEVAEACCGCMLAQADDAERRDMLPAAQERIILEEFGRCLGQIVESACKALPIPSYQHHPGAGLGLSGPGGQCPVAGNTGLVLHPGGSGALMPMGEMTTSVNDENVMVDV